MAKKNRREEHSAKNDQRLNRALNLFTVGFIAECYLLTINKLFVRGTVSQLVAVSMFLEAMVYGGLVLVAAGILLHVFRGKKHCFEKIALWCMGLGVFFTLSSQLMLKIYPAGTTIMCILIPVLMLLSVVYLLYPVEFSVEATALVLTIAIVALVNHGASSGLLALLIKCGAAGAAVLLAAAAIAVFLLHKRGGVYGGVTVFTKNTGYGTIYAVLALCLVCTLIALLIPGTAYYILWIVSVAMFLMAVLHTVKML